MIEWPNQFLPEMPPGTEAYFQELKRLGWDEIGRGEEAICFRNLRQDDRKGEIVLRLNHDFDYQTGLHAYYRHLLCRNLDDHFRHLGLYQFEHISRPQAPVTGGYYYDYVPGDVGFSWDQHLAEWHEFVSAFKRAGVLIDYNVGNPENKTSENVVLNGNHFYRIDFGQKSVLICKRYRTEDGRIYNLYFPNTIEP